MAEIIPSRHERLSRIAQIGILFSTERHLHSLLQLIVREARSLTNADAGTLYLAEGDVLKRAFFEAEGIAGTAPAQLALNTGSLGGQALLGNRLINVPNIRSFPEEHPAHLYADTHYQDYAVQSLLVIPLTGGHQQKIGVLNLLNARSPEGGIIPFDENLGDLLAPMATQAAIAIQNVRWGLDIQRSYHDTLFRLALAAEYRDDPTGSHIRRIGMYCELMAQAYGLTSRQVEMIRVASPLHDIGKIAIPESILLKPGKLTPDEFATIKKHTTIGALMLDHAQSEILQMAERIARTHHEKFDGSGYPDGLQSADIPIEGRIMAVADAFDAITTPRPYKAPLTVDQAVESMKRDSEKHFDPDCLKAFWATLPKVCEIFQSFQGTFVPSSRS